AVQETKTWEWRAPQNQSATALEYTYKYETYSDSNPNPTCNNNSCGRSETNLYIVDIPWACSAEGPSSAYDSCHQTFYSLVREYVVGLGWQDYSLYSGSSWPNSTLRR